MVPAAFVRGRDRLGVGEKVNPNMKADDVRSLIESIVSRSQDGDGEEFLDAVNDTIFNGEWRAQRMRESGWDANSVIEDSTAQVGWASSHYREYDT